MVFGNGICAQANLVLNSSFEDTTSTTSGYPYLITTNWWSPNGGDADYFTPFCNELCSCGSGATHCAGEIDYLGFQLAQDGASYLGLDIYESTGDSKEYGQGFLSEPMIVGHSYCVGIWICLADSASFLSCDFQVAFTNEQILDGSTQNLFLEDFVAYDISGINDSTWTLFDGVYVSHGGEQYIYLGSNTPNDELTCVEELMPTIIWNASYILVDNVSVIDSKDCDLNVTGNQALELMHAYPNPVSNMLTISGLAHSLSTIKIFDAYGLLWHKWIVDNGIFVTSMSELDTGIYFLVIEQDTNTQSYKICKE